MGSLYLIGSLRNPRIPEIADRLRTTGFEVVDDWYAAGPEADERWQQYEKARGRTFKDALDGLHADHVFSFDHRHLDRVDGVVLVTPAGHSAHLEFGYAIGSGKWGIVLLDEPERWDVMYRFASEVVYTIDDLVHNVVLYQDVPF